MGAQYRFSPFIWGFIQIHAPSDLITGPAPHSNQTFDISDKNEGSLRGPFHDYIRLCPQSPQG